MGWTDTGADAAGGGPAAGGPGGPVRVRADGGADGGAAARPPRPWIDDPFAAALRAGCGPLWLRRADGGRHRLEVERWCAPPDAADRSVLGRCAAGPGPVLDVGCGPGRLVAELMASGVPALGVDVVPAAVARTRGLGGSALRRSVFDRLPGEGRWSAVLLIDGNLGIGGDPAALLGRGAALLAPGGRLIAEVDRSDADERVEVCVEDGQGRRGTPFRWARLGLRAAVREGVRAGLRVAEAWDCGARRFVTLER
ncbi:class I SAM-dependent methyltransferase [Streptacidiphilus sp. ASG 303]|uniref:methyltransferase domain-containing protein n=1 Tax=Streptacidiphilus sp. ASG 303 TaxID=2896847 RepID=UPI001E42B4DC|nr:methyltransferase domain-containing protein [Streptacidiphilus sp. ASG 303]MCD0483298.1 class I SAM-dependent methyltransferase [Streptacidiphilus sp. ASG 303]